MVIDTSAIVAILLNEPESPALTTLIARSPSRAMSAMSRLEADIVALGRLDVAGLAALDRIIASLDLEIVPFDGDQATLAREAFMRFGKGRHRAGLNFGDCAAYALAKQRGEKLLFKGTDFAATDLAPA
jgi:ribonuclease VapC